MVTRLFQLFKKYSSCRVGKGDLFWGKLCWKNYFLPSKYDRIYRERRCEHCWLEQRWRWDKGKDFKDLLISSGKSRSSAFIIPKASKLLFHWAVPKIFCQFIRAFPPTKLKGDLTFTYCSLMLVERICLKMFYNPSDMKAKMKSSRCLPKSEHIFFLKNVASAAALWCWSAGQLLETSTIFLVNGFRDMKY